MAKRNATSEKPSIAFVGDYVPRQCGIATFTYDLSTAVAKAAGDNQDVFVVAMNDNPEGYPYPQRVRFEVRQPVVADYRLAAEFLNIQQVSAVCLQHEYGIFGGPYGSHILGLLRRIRRPLVSTLHTVLKEPNQQQLIAMKEIARVSDRLVVMSETAREILREVFGVDNERIVTIPHGIPDVPFVDPNFYKDKFGIEGRKVILTAGLLSPGKGLEYVVQALPEVVKKHPDVVYIILGATHPHVKRENGEEYRNSLYRQAEELGVQNNLVFQNRFVELQELCEYLGAADICITPYLNEAQVTSGTLAYALGTGKAVISTPYWHAKELLADGRGRLVPFRNSEAISTEIIDLLDNETARHTMRKEAYSYTRKMVWSEVAKQYMKVFKDASKGYVRRRGAIASSTDKGAKGEYDLPETDLRHLRTMTDHTGVLQHCLYATPDRRYGYATDDNARALIAAGLYWDQTHDNDVNPLIQTYLSFISNAFDEKSGWFRNYVNYDRSFMPEPSSEDSHAMVLWGLGMGVALCPHESMIALATRMFLAGLPATEGFRSPRAWAFTIVGLHAYLRRFGGDSEVRRYRTMLTDRLMNLFTSRMSDDWPWCEDIVSYASAKLPHALLMSGKWLQRGDMIDVGKHVLHWLVKIQTGENGMLSLIGTQGWYNRGGDKARFDQQPIDAHALVDACIEAYRVTREEQWIDEARRAFNWFLGANDLRTPIYDFTTGGCRDGLHADRVNENQGAESTLAWLMSLLQIQDLQMEQTLGELPADKEIPQRPVARAIKPSGPVVGARVK